MRKLSVISFIFLFYFISSIYSQVIINEPFNNGVQAPEGWNIKVTDTYESEINSGEQIPALRFSIKGQLIETSIFSRANGFSFWAKGNSTDSASTLLFYIQSNNTWYALDSLSNITVENIYNFPLPDTATQLRIVFKKSAGYIAFDDLKVFNNIVTSDSVAPSFTNNTPAISNIKSTSCDIAVSLNLSGTLHYLVLPENEAPPSLEKIKESILQNSGHIFISPNAAEKLLLTNLLSGTKYIAYFIKNGREPQYLCDSVIHAVHFQTKVTQNDLFFSKIYRGASNNKIIEIYNPSTDTVYLNTYRIALATNGSGWKTSYFIFPSESIIPPKDVYVIAKTTADSSIIDFTQVDFTTTSTLIAFTGNDARALQKLNNNGSWFNVDIYGDPLSDIDFTIAGITSAGSKYNIIRKQHLQKGNTNWAVSAGIDSSNSEWQLIPLANFVGIGKHDVQIISTINISSLNNEESISIFPNPAKRNFKILSTHTKKFEISLISIDGKINFTKKCQQNESIEVGKFPRGLYYIMINFKNSCYIKPLVLN